MLCEHWGKIHYCKIVLVDIEKTLQNVNRTLSKIDC